VTTWTIPDYDPNDPTVIPDALDATVLLSVQDWGGDGRWGSRYDRTAATTSAIAGVRNRGGIVVLVAHRPNVLISVDTLLALANGSLVSMGARDEILSKMLVQRPAPRPPLTIVPDTG